MFNLHRMKLSTGIFHPVKQPQCEIADQEEGYKLSPRPAATDTGTSTRPCVQN